MEIINKDNEVKMLYWYNLVKSLLALSMLHLLDIMAGVIALHSVSCLRAGWTKASSMASPCSKATYPPTLQSSFVELMGQPIS